MAKHLRPTDIKTIVDIIRGWSTDKITWEDICKAAGDVVGATPTRQTLNAHAAIKEAYSARRKGLKLHSSRSAIPSSLAVAAQRITRLQAENDELKQKNNALLEKFVKWQYNSYKHGIKEHQLNEDLPRIDRERTDGVQIPSQSHSKRQRRA